MLSQPELEALKAQHGITIHVVGKGGKWEVVLRKPKRAEWKRVRAMLHNPATKAEANEQLVRMCAVHPAREALDTMLEEYPALSEAVGANAQLAEELGLTEQDQEK